MGDIMREDDTAIPGLLNLLNLRFAPTPEPQWLGGINEMAAIQKEFQVFQVGRSFRDSAQILNLGGFWNARAKTRWYELLKGLQKLPSNVEGLTGDQAIVKALIDDLAARRPQPVYFGAHDLRQDKRVIIGGKGTQRPIFYIEKDYLTISLPMKPKSKPRAAAKKK
jgi:hypothetical protein